jgi:hypothetical protein
MGLISIHVDFSSPESSRDLRELQGESMSGNHSIYISPSHTTNVSSCATPQKLHLLFGSIAASLLISLFGAAPLQADPFGTPIGSFNSVIAYSNGTGTFDSMIHNNSGGVRTGLEWQCVEYINRYYDVIYGVNILSPAGNASAYFNSAVQRGLTSYPNGGTTIPQVGDILCFSGGAPSGGQPGAGHAAIIRSVSASSVTVIQQNVKETSADANFTYPMSNNGGRYLVDGSRLGRSYACQGWLRVPNATPPPTITSVNPNPITGSNNFQKFTIDGTGFVRGARVVLRDLTTNQPAPRWPVLSFTSTELVLYPIFSTSADDWSVEVINPDGSTAGPYEFSVAAPNTPLVSRTSHTSNALYAVTNGHGSFVAVGANGTILTSPDGVAWNSQNSRTSQNLQAITYGNGLFVAGGANGTILTSPDAVNWTIQTGAFNYTSYTQANDNVYTLTYGGGFFGLSGEASLIQTSPNGTSWAPQGTFGLANIYGSTYGNGTFVFGGYYNPSAGVTTGIVVTSPDGTHWTQSNVASYALHGVAYGNGNFVAVGDFGTIDTSPAGASGTWVARGASTMAALLGITYGNGFVAVGANGTVLSSGDGVSWTSKASGVGYNLNGATYSNGTFVIVGDNGTILQSKKVPFDPFGR